MARGDRPSAEQSRFAPAVSLGLVGLLYAGAEYARQAWWRPSPPGIPGDSGGDPIAFLALGLTMVTLPGLLAWGGLRASRRLPLFLVWAVAFWAALLPTTLIALDSIAEILRWRWTRFEHGGVSYYSRLLLLGGAVVLVPGLVAGWRRPLARLGARLGVLAAVVTVVAPFTLAVSLRDPVPVLPRGPVPSAASPCVLLLTIDTLRQDALAPYGGPVALPAAMAGARVFDGYSVSSWTLPAMASLFSGVAPAGHGGDGYHAPAAEVAWWPERWRESGWTTAAVVGNPFLRRRFAFDRGFTHFEHAEELRWLEPIARTFWAEWWQRRVVDRTAPDRADHRVERAMQWLDGSDPARPWLLWVHFMDPHLPYHLRGAQGALAPPSLPDWVAPLRANLEEGRFTDLEGARGGRVVTTEQQREALHRLYLTEVDFALHWIAQLVESATAAAGERGLLWVLSSDHGEEFWDEGGFEHGHSFTDAVLRVPLLMGGSAAATLGLADSTRLRLVDLGPVLTPHVGLGTFDPRPHSGLIEMPTRLDPFALGSVPSPAESVPLLVEGVIYGPPRTLVVARDGTAIERLDETSELRPHLRWGGELDSTAIDQLQTVLFGLDLWRERNAHRGAPVGTDPDLLRRLRAVGYVQ